jgi:hypothetical protein
MGTSDIAYYTGHGRYGSGPDFDPDFTKFELLDAKGQVTKTVLDHDLGPRQADVLASTTSLDWGLEGKTLAAFLDDILKQRSAEETVTNMDKQQGKKQPEA